MLQLGYDFFSRKDHDLHNPSWDYMMQNVRIGIVGLGKNTRNRHVPGFRAIEGVELVSVCNRRAESTQKAAEEFDIPKTFNNWEHLASDDDIDAVMIGTWPYLHHPIALAALENGKHLLTEARMACNLAEAHQMVDAANAHPDLVTQIVPSPFGLRAGNRVREMLGAGYLGELREFVVRGANSDFSDPNAELHWRQSAEFSGINMLALGILHETLIRWIPDPSWVFASTNISAANATRPDSAHILTRLDNEARGIYHLSGVVHHGGQFAIELYGTAGTIKYELGSDRLMAADRDDESLREVDIPVEEQGGWKVEADFIEAIRGGPRPTLTDFATGLRYMEFTDAVERSAQRSMPVALPLTA